MGEQVKLQHKHIDAEQCPRCGSMNTLGRQGDPDGEPEGTVLCQDCGGTYEVVREYGIKYVYWTDDEGEHTIYDTDHLVKMEAANLLHIAEQLVLWEQDPARYGGDLADLARQAQEIVNRAKGRPHE